MILLAGDRRATLSHALFCALWVEDRDIDDPVVLAQIADSCGFDGADLVARSGDQAVKDKLREQTETARGLGVFGAPTWIVYPTPDSPGQLYWGQDRLELVAQAAQGWNPTAVHA